MSKKPQEPSLKKNAFVHKLYSMLSDSKMSHLIWWTENSENNTFSLNPGKEFANSLTRYFKHGNVASFVRQLHMYGFHKVSDPNHSSNSSDEDHTIWEFKHLSGKFKKDDESSLVYIKRRSSSNTPRCSTDNTGNDNMLLASGTHTPSSFNYQNLPHLYQQQYIGGSYVQAPLNHPHGGYPPRMGHLSYPVPYQTQVYGYLYDPVEHPSASLNTGISHYSQQQGHNLPQQIFIDSNHMNNGNEHQQSIHHLQHRIPHSNTYLSPLPHSQIPPIILRPHSTNVALAFNPEKAVSVRQNSEPSNLSIVEPILSHQPEPSNLQFKKIWDNSNTTKQRHPSLLFDPLAPSPIQTSLSPSGRDNQKSAIKLPPPSLIHKSSPTSDPLSPEHADINKARRSMPTSLESQFNQKSSGSIPGSPNFNRKPSSIPIGHSIRELLRPSLLELYKPERVGSSISNNGDSIGSQSSQNSIFSAHSSISSISSTKRSSFGSFSHPAISSLHKNSILIGPKDPIPGSESVRATTIVEGSDDNDPDPSIKRQHLLSPKPTLPSISGDLLNSRYKARSPLSTETTNMQVTSKSSHNSKDFTDRGKVSVDSLLDSTSMGKNEAKTINEDGNLNKQKTEE